MKPCIGVTLDWERGDINRYSRYPWYALREHYCTSITQHGGIVLPLPHVVEDIDTYLSLVQGVVVTGGDFDVSPHFSGQAEQHPRTILKQTRTQFEMALITKAMERQLPLLGICGGAQVLNVALGGTLIQHIPDTVANALAHEQPNPRHEVGHSADILEGTLLWEILKTPTIQVNSAHHQAVETLGNGLVINAKAPDGVIEGFEMTNYPFGLGLQWHPEFLITQADHLIFESFIRAARVKDGQSLSSKAV